MWGELARRMMPPGVDTEERPVAPRDVVDFMAPCDVCGVEVTWHGGLRVMQDPNAAHNKLTVSTSWTDHCEGVAA